MSVVTTCDRCKKVIDEVAYMVVAVDAAAPDLQHPITGGRTHLHWECVPLYGRNEPKDQT